MQNNDIATMLRAVIQEELQQVREGLKQEVRSIVHEALQPINERLGTLEQGQTAIVKRLDTLEKGQRQLQKDVSGIKFELRGVWEDILRLDKRLASQEKITGSR